MYSYLQKSTDNGRRAINSLMIMCTYACQFNCRYCEIEQSSSSMKLSTLYGAIDLLLTTKSKECRLRFWGGEPLLKWDFIKRGIQYATKRAKEKNKKIRFMITTNGLFLDKKKVNFLYRFPVEIMFSLDGNRKVNDTSRLLHSGNSAYASLLKNLQVLKDSGLPYFINTVCTPATVNGFSENLNFLKNHHIEKVQLCYQCGTHWQKRKEDILITEINKFNKREHSQEFLMNFVNNCEPTILSQEIIADTDGKVYFDAAIFMEKVFPNLRQAYFLGSVHDIGSIDTLHRSKSQLYSKFINSCSASKKQLFTNNLNFGLRLKELFRNEDVKSTNSNENSRLTQIINTNFASQHAVLKKIGLNCLFLYINGPCLNNCIFCKHKDSAYSELFEIENKLKSNLRLNAKKLCIVGNDPLLHPDIRQVIRLAKNYGFKDIEIMTSGELLSDSSFLRNIVNSGVTSFSLPLYSVNDRVHDFIVGRKGSFAQVHKGIKNVMKQGLKLYIHTNLLRKNLSIMRDLGHHIKKQLNLPFVILPIRPKFSNMPFDELMPSYATIIKQLQGVDSLLGFPLCVTRKIQKRLIEKEEISDSMKAYFLSQKFIKTNICQECLYRHKCVGLFSECLRGNSRNAIKPFKRSRAGITSCKKLEKVTR